MAFPTVSYAFSGGPHTNRAQCYISSTVDKAYSSAAACNTSKAKASECERAPRQRYMASQHKSVDLLQLSHLVIEKFIETQCVGLTLANFLYPWLLREYQKMNVAMTGASQQMPWSFVPRLVSVLSCIHKDAGQMVT